MGKKKKFTFQGTGNAQQENVANLMNKTEKLDFIISTGDNIFPNGVQNASDGLIKKLWNDVYNGAAPLSQIPWYLVLGARDWKTNGFGQVYQRSGWNLPSLFHVQDRIFIGGERAQFIFIDTTRFSDQDRLDYPDTVGKLSKEEMEKELENVLSRFQRQYRWRFVIGHHNVYGSGVSGDWGHKNMTSIETLFKKYDVDAYFSGQDSILQVLEDKFKPSNRSLSYFVSGSGGQSSTANLSPNPKNVFGLDPSEEGYLIQKLTVNEFTLEVIAKNGSSVFQYKCQKASNNEFSKCN
jgi:tartrate-resistant acid phosphatase type 5